MVLTAVRAPRVVPATAAATTARKSPPERETVQAVRAAAMFPQTAVLPKAWAATMAVVSSVAWPASTPTQAP